jgi:hypothetical protein
MDCPNCGVYNPEERTVCWRCDEPLPKPEPSKRRRSDPEQARRRMLILFAVAMLLWVILSWLLPALLSGPVTPVP